MQLRNEIKHLLYLNVLTLSFLLCFDCAYLTCLLLRSWAQAVACPKGVIGDTQACFGGASGKFPIHPTWLINRLSYWLLRAQLDFLNSPGTDSYPFVSYYSGGAPSEGFATLRNVPKLLTRFWAILSARARVSRAKGDVNTWQTLLGVLVRLELTEPLWWPCNNLSQANSPCNGYRMFACHLK